MGRFREKVAFREACYAVKLPATPSQVERDGKVDAAEVASALSLTNEKS